MQLLHHCLQVMELAQQLLFLKVIICLSMSVNCPLLSLWLASQLVSDPEVLSVATLSEESEELCHKETGSRKLRKWSRGHQFIVRGGGHIDAWQPLYK